LRDHLRVTETRLKRPVWQKKQCGAAPAVGTLDPGFPT